MQANVASTRANQAVDEGNEALGELYLCVAPALVPLHRYPSWVFIVGTGGLFENLQCAHWQELIKQRRNLVFLSGGLGR